MLSIPKGLNIHTVVEKKSFWTLHAFVMYCIVLSVGLQSPSAVYFCAVINIYPQFTTGCVSGTTSLINTSKGQERQEFCFLISILKNNNNNETIFICMCACDTAKLLEIILQKKV